MAVQEIRVYNLQQLNSELTNSPSYVCGNTSDVQPNILGKLNQSAAYNTSVHWRMLANTNVTWSFENYTTDTTQSAQIWIAHHAFSMWESESNVNFTYDPTGNGQIKIYFSRWHCAANSGRWIGSDNL